MIDDPRVSVEAFRAPAEPEGQMAVEPVEPEKLPERQGAGQAPEAQGRVAGRLTEKPRQPPSGGVAAGRGPERCRIRVPAVGRRAPRRHEEPEAQAHRGGVEQTPGQEADDPVSRPETSAPGQHRRHRPQPVGQPHGARSKVKGRPQGWASPRRCGTTVHLP